LALHRQALCLWGLLHVAHLLLKVVLAPQSESIEFLILLAVVVDQGLQVFLQIAGDREETWELGQHPVQNLQGTLRLLHRLLGRRLEALH
jgi:hypothetical protein